MGWPFICRWHAAIWSAPKIFTAVADALEWCVRQAGVEDVYHYQDDYAVIGPNLDVCQYFLVILEKVCAHLGVLLAPGKKDAESPFWGL